MCDYYLSLGLYKDALLYIVLLEPLYIRLKRDDK